METSKKARAEVLLTAQQISLAKVLAANDKAVRDKGIKRLSKWITARSGSTLEFTEQDLMTIWKGLFYCVWMADKPLYQEELAERIASLIHSFKKVEQGFLYVECFLLTMKREWFGIDQHRLDKFMMLVRRCIRQLFVYCSSRSWPSEAYEGISGLLERGITSSAESSASMGLLFHVADIILEELAKVKSPEKGLQAVLLPFAALIACDKDGRIRQHVSERVFHHLIQQSPLGIEFQEKFEAWKQAGFPGNSWRDMVSVDISDEEELPNEEQSEDEISASGKDEKLLDPRAGKVDIELPTIDFNATEIAKLLKAQIHKTTNVKQRKALNVLVSQFLTLSNGQYPLGFKKPPGSTDRRNRAEHREELWQAAEDLIQFEEQQLQRNPDNDSDNNTNSQPGKKRKRQDADTEIVQSKKKKKKLFAPEKPVKNAESIANLQKSSADITKSRKNNHHLSKGKKSSTVARKRAEEEQDKCELPLEGSDDVMLNDFLVKSQKSDATLLCHKGNENEGPSNRVVSEKETGVVVTDKLAKRKKKIRENSEEGRDTRTPVVLITRAVSKVSQPTKSKKSKQNSKVITRAQNDENPVQQPNVELVSDISNCNQINNLHAITNGIGDKVKLCTGGQSPETRGKRKLNGSIGGDEMNILCTDEQSPKTRGKRKLNDSIGGDEMSILRAGEQSPKTRGKRKLNGSVQGGEINLCIANTPQRLSNSANVTKVATRSSLPLQHASPQFTPKKRNSLSSWIVTDISQQLSADAAVKGNVESTSCTATHTLPGTTQESMKSSIKAPKKGRKAENEELATRPAANSLLVTTQYVNSSCVKTPKSAKKVNIVLNKNIAHEERDYRKVVKQSPTIPFDATKKPVQGVLKAGHFPSPVNPFYRKSQRLKL